MFLSAHAWKLRPLGKVAGLTGQINKPSQAGPPSGRGNVALHSGLFFYLSTSPLDVPVPGKVVLPRHSQVGVVLMRVGVLSPTAAAECLARK